MLLLSIRNVRYVVRGGGGRNLPVVMCGGILAFSFSRAPGNNMFAFSYILRVYIYTHQRRETHSFGRLKKSSETPQ